MNNLKYIREFIIEAINNDNIFKNNTTSPDYDEVLRNDPNRYLKNIQGEIVNMSPEEYLNQCAKMQGTTLEKQKHYINKDNVNKLIQAVKQGSKLNLPYLDYVNKQQEGRHRVYAAELLGYETIPIAIFKPIQNNNNDDGEYTLEQLSNRLKDVKVDNNNKPYIEYNINSQSDITKFIQLFPNTENIYELFLHTLNYKPVLNKTESIPGVYIDPTNTTVDKYTELQLRLINSINQQNITDEDIINDLKQTKIHWTDIMNILNTLAKQYNVMNDTYEYITQLINSVFAYMYYYNNIDYFKEIKNKNYKVIYNIDNNIIRLYSDDIYSEINNFSLAKDILSELDIKLKDEEPYIQQENNLILLSSDIINMYTKQYPININEEKLKYTIEKIIKQLTGQLN